MRLFNIIRKDLKILLSDRKALAISMLMPVILTTILSFALKGVFTTGGGTERIRVAVVKMYDKDTDYKAFINTMESGLFKQSIDEKSLEKLKAGAEDFDIEKIFFEEFLRDEDISKVIDYRKAGKLQTGCLRNRQFLP
ncbi:MAG: hypothetical protein ACM3TR_01625 [Caulobacteraceae bacterium]